MRDPQKTHTDHSHSNHSHATKKHSRGGERRNREREIISTPVRVRGVVGPDRHFDETTTTVNLSPSGILIETTSDTYYRTMRVSVILAYEEAIGSVQVEQEGRVVRITDLSDGRRSVAIALAHGTSEEKRQPEPDEKGWDIVTKAVTTDAAGEPGARSVAPLVLVLESETAASEFMKAYLSAEGYEVIAVETLAEARNVLEERTPSLLIAEVEGEGMPGYSLCSHCKQTPRLKPVPVMLLTSSAYPSDYARAHSLGAVVCMAKPYKRERLGHVVRLLAPPPGANEATPVRQADASRHAGVKTSKASADAGGKRFRLSTVFGR